MLGTAQRQCLDSEVSRGWRGATGRLAYLRGRRPAVVLLAFLLLAGWATVASAFEGKVIGVADGDTITVLRDHQPEILRLNGIDTPESGQAFGNRAKQFTAQLAFGQIVQVIARDQDRYGRTVADVVLADGRSLNHELVRAGYAWWFRRYSSDATLATLESEARAARRGLWADPHPVAPWEWRQGQRELVSGSSAPSAQAQSVLQAPQPQATGGPIIGNRRSRVYHRPDCPSYAAVAPQNRVPFASAAEAEGAGYRLAGNCP
jgi:micrococcal nuclease